MSNPEPQCPTPNRLTVQKCDSKYSTHFGSPIAAVPMQHVAGLGHDEKVRLTFKKGPAFEFVVADAIKVSRMLHEAAVASMRRQTPGEADLGGAVWGKGEFD